MAKDLFAQSSTQTLWEWAKARRQHFRNPWRDAAGAAVVGVLTGAVKYFAGAPDWRGALLVGLAAGAGGRLVLPWLEAVYWWGRRDSILLEETTSQKTELEAELDAMQREATTSQEQLRKAIGKLKLEYERLERAFIAQKGDWALSHKQTQLHNAAYKVISARLGIDRFAQFKSAKQVPLVIHPISRTTPRS